MVRTPPCHGGGCEFESRPDRQLNNKMTSQITLIFFNLMIVGVIFTHIFLTTPVVFKILDEASSSEFLRGIFPRYYLLILVLSFPILLISFFNESSLYWWLAVNVSFHAFIGLIGIPFTNVARDRGWDKLFNFSHGLSVYCTIVITILSLIQFFFYISQFSSNV